MIKKFNVKKTKRLNIINKILSLFYKKKIVSNLVILAEIRNILVIDFSLIGDIIMDIPFLLTIKRNCPNAKITMVCMPWAEIILKDQSIVDEFIVFNGKEYISSPINLIVHLKKIRNVLKIINQKKYDIGFEPKGDLRHILFLRYTRCDRTVSYNYTGGDYLVTDSFKPKSETKHLLDEKMDLLEMMGFKIFDDDRHPVLKITNIWKKFVVDFCKEHVVLDTLKVIGLHPGASTVNKQYHLYPQLVCNLDSFLDKNTMYFVFEGPEDIQIVDSVVESLNGMRRRYLRIKRSLKEYLSLVSRCDFMICNDSAAGHIATAYGIPTVVVFGPVMPETAVPRGNCKIEYISHDIKCKPCTLPFCPLETEYCIKSISVDEVLNKCKSILS